MRASAVAAQDNAPPLMIPVRMFDGVMTPAERTALVRESTRFGEEGFLEEFQWEPQTLRAAQESFARGRGRFSFATLNREINRLEEAAGRRIKSREAITTSQSATAISMIVVNAIMDAWAAAPALWRTLAEISYNNAESEIYPEMFFDDIPVRTGETEPAAESRMGEGVFRIRNVQYARALAISKRRFELDDVGGIRTWVANFGKKYPIVQDRTFLNGIFRTFQYANMTIYTGGIVPPTNIAGGMTLAGAPYTNTGGALANGFFDTASRLTPASIEAALLRPSLFTDPFGNLIGGGIDFDTLICDSLEKFVAKRFVTSNYNPVQLVSGDTSGTAPGAFTNNVLQGEFTVASSPYVKLTRAPLSGNGYPWAMGQAGNMGAVMQIAKEWNVEQETPMGGKSFDEASFRWRGGAYHGTGMRSGRLMFVAN